MVTFDGGPADGQQLDIERLPHYLRIVTVPTLLDPAAGLDCLDALDDEPRPDETVSVYRLVENGGRMHVNIRPRHKWTAFGKYRHLPNVDGEQLRDTPTWQAWAEGRPNIYPAEIGGPAPDLAALEELGL